MILCLYNPIGIDDQGFPRREAFDVLSAIEDRLIEALDEAGGAARHVAVVTVPGLRDFIFAVEDDRLFLTQAVAAADALDVGIEVNLESNNGFYDDFIAPSETEWHQIGNAAVVGNLIQNGSNPKALHPIEHFFAVEDGDQITDLRAALEEEGFSFGSLSDENLMMIRPRQLNVAEINQDTDIAVLAAENFGQRYAGWGSPIIT